MLYSINEIKSTYQQVHDLLVTKYIIKSYSTNNADIRKIAITGLDLSKMKKVLELGCGYGFFLEALNGRLDDNAYITGIDLVENNREAYLHAIDSIGYRGEFITDNADTIKSFKNDSYDFIIACYSLYFFPHLIEVISRILKPNGLFVTITHSKFSLMEIIDLIQECLNEMDIGTKDMLSLQKLIMSFSTENGMELLNPYFTTIDLVEYKNSMKFSIEHVDDCIYYIEKKRKLIYKEILEYYPDKVVDLEINLSKKVYERARRENGIVITKDDSIFRCYL